MIKGKTMIKQRQPRLLKRQYEYLANCLLDHCKVKRSLNELTQWSGFPRVSVAHTMQKLVAEGKVKRLKRGWFKAVAADYMPEPAATTIAEQLSPYIEIGDMVKQNLGELAKEYVWQTGANAEPIRAFVAWVEGGDK